MCQWTSSVEAGVSTVGIVLVWHCTAFIVSVENVKAIIVHVRLSSDLGESRAVSRCPKF